MVFSRGTVIAWVTVLLLIVGCTAGGNQTPTTPAAPEVLTSQLSAAADNSRIIWELGEVVIYPDTGTAEVIPLRTAEFNVNIVKFLQPPAGNSANLSVQLDLPNCNIPNAYIDLDCTLTHPFPGTQYWGFDTRVIVFAGGSTTGKHDTSVKYPTASELRMVNADGYTRWWNRTEFGPVGKLFGYTEGVMAPSFTPSVWSTVNGYKYYANGISPTQMPPNPAVATRGVFSSGSVTREMKLQFPKVSNPFKFKYSVDTSWEAPTKNPPTSVNDFPPQANTEEAYQIVVTQDPASTAFYDPDDGTFGGDLILSIEVWDWRQNGGSVEAEIGGIWVESPTLLSNQGGVVKIDGTWTVSPGSSPNSVIYSGTLSNVTPTAVQGQELFITVESSNPTTYEPPVSGFLYPNKPLAAYQLFPATIKDAGTPPVKSITVTSPNGGETLIIGQSHEITWTWTGSIANVVIEYSTDGGATYPNVITASTPCDGSYTWSPIPDTPTTQARVRITEAGASPEAQDASDNNFTISTEQEKGWNPIPGMIGMPVNDPAPNQSTVTPDLGIQNDDAGAEGAWMVDQQGGIPDGTPYFFDYLLDWSGPGGNAYPSGFNYNFAPFGRHDVSSNGVVITGSSAREVQTSPPIINDPITSIWYISYLLDDSSSTAGDLYWVQWGDEGTSDPPQNDPDAVPWFTMADISGGMPGQDGDTTQHSLTGVMVYSHLTGAPPIPQADSGDLPIIYWEYPYDATTNIFRLGFPEYTTDNKPAPLFEAFDVSDWTKIRIGADTDSYLTFDSALPNTATLITMIDSVGNIYSTGFQLDIAGMQFYYIGLGNTMKIFKTSPDYPSGGTAVDLEYLPTCTYLYGGDWEQGFNWVAVLFKVSGGWLVRVYYFDWTTDPWGYTIIDTTDTFPGEPLALDVDYINFHIHVLAKDGATIKATVFEYTP